MLLSPLPTWKDIFGLGKEKDMSNLLSSGTAASLSLIFEAYRDVYQKKSITILLPDYFCGETENIFLDSDVLVFRYPITKSLEPDWQYIKERYSATEVEFFLLVHYFGMEKDCSKAREFCNLHNISLIEDCAHSLYSYGRMGTKGDFVLFSPHKFLPIPDGGIIKINQSEKTSEKVIQYIKEKLDETTQKKFLIWRVKKIFLKLFKLSKEKNFTLGPHFIKRELCINDFGISRYSQKILSRYTDVDYKSIAYQRRQNLALISSALLNLNPDIKVLVDENAEAPLFAAYSLENVKEPLCLVDQLKDLGFNVSYWPSVSDDITFLSDVAEKYSKYVITIPIHQSLSIYHLARVNQEPYRIKKAMFQIEELDNSIAGKRRWEQILSLCTLSNITQDYHYADVKKKVENWSLKRFIIKDDNKDIGLVQLLIKKIFGIPVALRVNKGPIFLDSYLTLDNEMTVIAEIRKNYSLRPFFYVPYTPYTEDNLRKMLLGGWKIWDRFGFPSGYIDLSIPEEKIRAQLDSKWRNQLKTAEKKDFVIKSDFQRYEEMLRLYQEEQRDKGFQGVSQKILENLGKEPSPLKILYVLNEAEEMIAFDMFYVHGKDATYYIGWNSEEGRRNYLNNLLLYYGAIALKKMGVKKLDLGGIEYIHTESIAKFKDGMKPMHFRQIGEFVRIL